MANLEGLGVFYLGEQYDLGAQKRTGAPLLYESKHLVTHALCVGMTGSGKTGLCIGLLEEAALDGIPALVIDPKGDLGNLLLQFPELRGEDFLPWVSEDEARLAQKTAGEFAEGQAEMWRKGLADWGQDGQRIEKLKDSAEFTIYTPGSRMGRPLSILKSFEAPGEAVQEDRELFTDRIANAATALLGLLGIDADPLQSREHIFLSQIIQRAWEAGQNLDLAALIGLVQNPGFKQIGVMDVDSFYPAKERFALAMQMNNLLASPGFQVWMEGEGMDVGALLRTPAGKPRISILSIAHLNDQERMFFVALLLNETLAWTRQQAGTSSLRAIVYMDEIFGYFPPTPNPPSKKPLLTLLKQARAFGVGLVLATQNPMDLDYKGLANCGTWFIGRLQAERDKQRLMEGLEGASAQAGAGFNKAETDRLLSSLGKRVFFLNNVHRNTPVLFQTRWTLSYLRGPLTRDQIKSLTAKQGRAGEAVAKQATPLPALKPAARPVLPPEVVQKFLPARGETDGLMYYPELCATVKIRYTDAKAGVDTTVERAYLTPIKDDNTPVEWHEGDVVELHPDELEAEPVEGIGYMELAGAATKAKSYASWQKDLVNHLFAHDALEILAVRSLKLYSAAGESEGEFRGRLAHALHEQRDAAVAKLQAKYDSKLNSLEERVRKAQQAKQREEQERSTQMMSAGLDILGGVFGAVFGKGKGLSKTSISKAASAARSAGRVVKQQGDVARAGETVEALEAQLAALEEEVEAATQTVAAEYDPAQVEVEKIAVKPKKANIVLGFTALVWAPYRPVEGAEPERAW
ncbi:MAG: ATP-binding protein [Bryobacter sp.]